MKLVKFEVSNFRSITTKVSIELKQFNVFVGANNIGKSNVLNAILLALDLVKNSDYIKAKGASGVVRYDRNKYIRERDFPLNLKNPDTKHTIFKLTFVLSEEERELLINSKKIKINKDISLRFDFSRDKATYNVLMPGKAFKKFDDNKHVIAKFIANNIKPIYIPCIRDADISIQEVQNAWQNELKLLSDDEEYVKCLNVIKDKEKELLDNMQKNILETVSAYIPDVMDVKFKFDNFEYRRRNGGIFIDDGIETTLELKGDGIKSLMAIALISRNSENASNSIFCVEEPEAHLHPSAIYGLKKILVGISEKNQVIVATHSPIIVDRYSVSNNFIVYKNDVKKCNNINEIRECLGIQVTDDLMGSELILLVEGQSDYRIIKKLLCDHFDVNDYEARNKLKIVNMRGGTKASNLVVFYNSLFIATHILLDNDSCGESERNKLISKGLSENKDVTMVSCADMKLSEIEDMILVDKYNNYILEKYSVNVKSSPGFNNKNKEWSTRIKDVFMNQGQPINDEIEEDIKTYIASQVEKEGVAALYPHRKEWVTALANSLKRKLNIR